MPFASRKRRVHHRLWNGSRNGRGRIELGRADGAHVDQPGASGSYERLCHESGVPAFLLHLRAPARRAVRDELMSPRLERAIGVVYRPSTEYQSHYFTATLPNQFDEYIWFDETQAVRPLTRATHARPESLPGTFPFGV